MKAAQKLLGGLTIGRGSALAGDSGGGSSKRQISPQPAKYIETVPQTGGFPHFWLKHR
jgi:hypothetical protein